VNGPTAAQVADRALLLYALARRASIELTLAEAGDAPRRFAQAETARVETDRWLARESLADTGDDVERRLLGAPSGSWPGDAVRDGLWRKEALGVLLWSLGHVVTMPPADEEFEVSVLNERIERYGSVSSFRANGRLRPIDELEAAWRQADAWLAATEGGRADDAPIASINAERLRALGWLRDSAAPLA
jgi:Domain of unknown function (DUF4272)